MAYLHGQRKPYVGPVPPFLIANALFFATESLTGGTVFTTPIDSHLHTQPWSRVAEVLVSHRLEAMQTTLDIYAPVFDHAMARNARSLIIFMVLSFVAVPSLAFYRSRSPLGAMPSFRSTCMRSCSCSSALRQQFRLLTCGSAVPDLPPAGWITRSPLPCCSLVECICVATGKVYGATGVSRVLKVVALTVAVASIVLGYRFVLLVITLYTT